LVGQLPLRERCRSILASGRLSHAYLFAGAKGTGTLALALAFAEAIQEGHRSWFVDPDTHVFLPEPSSFNDSARKERLERLHQDPYAFDHEGAPVQGDSKDQERSNLRSFYSIGQYREQIKPVTVLRPNTSDRLVVVLHDIHTMRAESANAFLKLLEEPPKDVLFLLTTPSTDTLMPTILSRCQVMRLKPCTQHEIIEALVAEGRPREDAQLAAQLSNGQVGLARAMDVDAFRTSKEELLQFLRASYTMDAAALSSLIQQISQGYSLEQQIAGDTALILHQDHAKVMVDFIKALQDARLEEMIDVVSEVKPWLMQNVQMKLILPVVSFRFAALMRGEDPNIARHEAWKHYPAAG
jgi:DNA polymerase-3 subunit delta'